MEKRYKTTKATEQTNTFFFWCICYFKLSVHQNNKLNWMQQPAVASKNDQQNTYISNEKKNKQKTNNLKQQTLSIT
jgi:hypothetical protein